MIHINVTPIAFYDSLDKQSHRLSYANGSSFCLVSPVNRLLPFQIIVEKTFPVVTAIYIIELSTGTRVNITSHFTAANWKRRAFTDYDILVYNDINALTTNLKEGRHYLEIVAGASILYSELFNAIQTVQASEVVGISFWDNEDFIFQHINGRLSYADNYQSKIYLMTKLAKPDYKIEEVIEERDGFKFTEKQIQKKVFRFSFLAPEYICDVLSLISMHDNVVLTHNGKIYNVYDILFTPTWTEDGFLANIDAEFTTDAVIKKIGKLFPKHNLGDFNNDFSRDFNVI